jgi:hypothetical protein
MVIPDHTHFNNKNANLSHKESDIINYDPSAEMGVFEIQSYIEEIENNSSLHKEQNFDKRIDVIDFIGFQVIDQIEEFLRQTAQPDKDLLNQLKHRAEKAKAELEMIDTSLFQRMQTNIRIEGFSGEAFKNLITEYLDFNVYDNDHQEEIGYDNLDILINGLSPFQPMPEQTKELEPEMVYYQKTPARIVFELVEKSHFLKEDVFFDLGAGLGQVAILVNLLAGITTKGVEIEPAYCDYARDCAAGLNLSNVTFINIDARQADYSDGTIFFMFTPFRGEILQEVLEILRKESLQRKIKIITYGPCTAQVALQTWLERNTSENDKIYRLEVFSSF